MNSNSFANQSFLKTVEPLSHNVYAYTQIEALEAELISEKAAFLVFKFNGTKHERWIPYSQLRKDTKENIWLSNWFIKQLKLNQESKFPPQETSGEIICDNQ